MNDSICFVLLFSSISTDLQDAEIGCTNEINLNNTSVCQLLVRWFQRDGKFVLVVDR